MEISPLLQLQALLAALCGGILFGGLYDAGRAVGVLLGAYRPPASMRVRYERPLPLLGHGVSFGERPAMRALRLPLTAVGEFFFCLGLLFLAEWVLYRFYDGLLRLSVPVAIPAGLGLWRLLTARLSEAILAHAAYALAVLLAYLRALLLLPFFLLRRILLLLLLPLRLLWRRSVHAVARRRTARLCRRQLALAAAGFAPALRAKKQRRSAPSRQ
jgi:hypothetical protein